MNDVPAASAPAPAAHALRPLDVVRGLYAAFARRDADAVLGAFDPAIEICQTPLLPWGGIHHGHDGARTFFDRLTSHIDSRVSIERLIEAGDHVVVVGRTAGTARTTGRAFDVGIAHVWLVADGRATRWEAYVDTPALLDAIGS